MSNSRGEFINFEVHLDSFTRCLTNVLQESQVTWHAKQRNTLGIGRSSKSLQSWGTVAILKMGTPECPLLIPHKCTHRKTTTLYRSWLCMDMAERRSRAYLCHKTEKMKHSFIQLGKEFVLSIWMSKDNRFCNDIRASCKWTWEDEGTLYFS